MSSRWEMVVADQKAFGEDPQMNRLTRRPPLGRLWCLFGDINALSLYDDKVNFHSISLKAMILT